MVNNGKGIESTSKGTEDIFSKICNKYSNIFNTLCKWKRFWERKYFEAREEVFCKKHLFPLLGRSKIDQFLSI